MSGIYFNFPTEYYQTLKKTSLFLYFYLLVSAQRSLKFEYLKFYRFVFFVAMLIGFVQILNIPGISEILIKFFGSTSEQIGAAQHDLPQYSQIYGTAGNPIIWGGLCVFIFYYFLFVESAVLYKYSGMLLAVINLMFASSRAGILSLLLSIIVLPLVIYLRGKSFKKLFSNYFYAFSLLALVFLIVQLVGSERLEFIKYRFFQLAMSSNLSYNELDPHDRINQIKSAFDLLNEDKLNYFFGLGSLLYT